MAVYRYYAECEVCKSITLIRVQVGHLQEYPVRIYCGNCEILFSGKVLFDEANRSVKLKLSNCNFIEKDEYEFGIEVSGDLPSMKLYKNAQDENPEYLITPFLRAVSLIGRERLDNFFELMPFLRLIKEQWPRIRRTNELLMNKRWSLLEEQILKIIPNKKVVLNNKIDYLMAVHQLTISYLSTPLKPTPFFENTDLVSKVILNIVKTNESVELRNFFNYFNNSRIESLNEKLFIRLNSFIERFQFLMPGYALFYISKEFEHFQMGVTTATLEDLKSFYIDCYETIMDAVVLLIAINNLIHRGSFRNMKEKRRDVSTIEQFEKIPNGKKIEFIDGNETLDFLLLNKLDNKLRNALGHASTRFDGIKQIITYYPNDFETDKNAEHLYLMDFIKKCIDQCVILLSVGELVYKFQQIKMIFNGQAPSGVNVAIDEMELLKTKSQNSNSKPRKVRNSNKSKRKSQKQARKRNRG